MSLWAVCVCVCVCVLVDYTYMRGCEREVCGSGAANAFPHTHTHPKTLIKHTHTHTHTHTHIHQNGHKPTAQQSTSRLQSCCDLAKRKSHAYTHANAAQSTVFIHEDKSLHSKKENWKQTERQERRDDCSISSESWTRPGRTRFTMSRSY